MKLHALKLEEGIFLDGSKLEGVKACKIDQEENSGTASLTLEMDVTLRSSGKTEIVTGIKNVKTVDLVRELEQREGVEVKYAEPHKDNEIIVNSPATILVVTD